MCRSVKIGDFTIGKWAIEELNSHLREYKLPLATARPFDPYGTITKALWKMRKFSLPQNKPLEMEDFVRDNLNENIYKDRRDKW